MPDKKQKLYILDTNVLMTDVDDPLEDIIYKIAGYSESRASAEPNDIVLLQLVRCEIDSLKQFKPGDGNEFRSYRARRVQDAIEKMLNTYEVKKTESEKYVELPNGAKIYFMDHNANLFEDFWKNRSGYSEDVNLSEKSEYIVEPKNDDKILFMAEYLANQHKNLDVCLISKDKNVRADANITATLNLRTENLRFDWVNPREIYTGLCKRIIPGQFSAEGLEILLNEDLEIKPNEFVEFSEGIESKKYGIIKLGKDGNYYLRPLGNYDSDSDKTSSAKDSRTPKNFAKKWNKIRSKQPENQNKENIFDLDDSPSQELKMCDLRFMYEQVLFNELLFDKSVELLSCYGPAGSGKTLFAARAGLKQVFDGHYKKVLYIRPLEKLGDDIGYIPGAIRDKIEPWVQPLILNLSRLWETEGVSKKNIEDEVKRLEKDGILEYHPPTFLRGVTLSNSFIIFDEVQTESRDTIKLILSRTGENSKMVMLGGPSQISKNVADQSFTLERFVHSFIELKNPHYGHINLSNKCVLRSNTAMMVAKAKY